MLHQLRTFGKLLEQEVFRRVGFSVCVAAFLFVLGLALFPVNPVEVSLCIGRGFNGWRLPTGGASGEFVVLDKIFGGTGADRTDATIRDKFLDEANSLYSGSVGYVGSGGDWWSSTTGPSTDPTICS